MTVAKAEVDTELRATDASRPAHQPTWDHCQQEGATCMFSGGTKRTENAGSNNRADAEGGQVERRQRPFQFVGLGFAIAENSVHGLGLEGLMHRQAPGRGWMEDLRGWAAAEISASKIALWAG